MKRTAIKIGLLAAALVALWVVWAMIAHHRLQSRLDEIAARHEPLNEQDLAPLPVPDSENAATYYKAAIAALAPGIYGPSSSSLNFPLFPPYPKEWFALADFAATANARAFALVRQARACNRVDWHFTIPPSVIGNQASMAAVVYPNFNTDRELCNEETDGAMDAHFRGDDAEAMERIDDALHLADDIGRRQAFIGRLVSIGCAALATNRLMIMAPGLHIAKTDALASTDLSNRPVSRAVVIRLIGELLNDRDAQQELLWAEYAQRVISIDVAKWRGDRQLILRPMFELQLCRVLDLRENEILALGKPDLLSAQAMFFNAPIPPRRGVENMLVPPRYSRYAMMLSHYPILRVELPAMCRRRAAAISLAVRLYFVEKGKWPQSLDALVPAYLPAVPLDPMQRNSTPVGYTVIKQCLPDGGDRPMIHFGGVAGPPAPLSTPTYDWDNFTMNWLDLSWWAPTSTQTSPN